MILKPCSKMPENGRFITVWRYKGYIWCSNFKKESGILLRYDDAVDGWVQSYDDDFYDVEEVTYLVES